ncbi:MAG: hypothetical protein WD872_06725 [Pirellulaceae bacterium]
MVAIVPAGAVQGAKTYQLDSAQAGGSHQRVKVEVEVEGELKLNSDGTEVKHLQLKVNAELEYVERTLEVGPPQASARVARSYDKAQAKIRLRDTDLANTLRDDRRLIVSQSSETAATSFSPLGPLTRDELELIDVPGSGLTLSALLPEKAMEIGDTWQAADWAVARLLGLEAINQHDVTLELTEVKDDLAIITLAGKVAGAIGGVSSEIELKGKLNFDLKQRWVTWLALAFQENRAIGHAQPGFKVLTQVRMVAAPIEAEAGVSDQTITGFPIKAAGGTTLIDFHADSAGYALIHDRRWNVMLDRHDATILRLVDRGDLIAQCNISRLPPLADGKQLALEGFEADVKRALGKNFGQVVEAAQDVSPEGIRTLRVIVSGTASELPIQWSYYHLSDDAGHRAALVFTLEGSLVERFPQIDRELIGGFRFLAEKDPTPAKAESETAAKP